MVNRNSSQELTSNAAVRGLRWTLDRCAWQIKKNYMSLRRIVIY